MSQAKTEKEMEQDHKKELAAKMREMRIQLIKEKHPVYAAFNFSSYTNEKVAEMYRKLVEEQTMGGNVPENGNQQNGTQ